jgi:four helix bundle protein
MKTEKELPRDIRERTLNYAVRGVRLSRNLMKLRDEAAKVIARQFLRSSTSVGANVEEAQFAESRADFIHMYRIARKEARESQYWLRLMVESGIMPRSRLTPLIKETEELVAIVTSIILTARKGQGLSPAKEGYAPAPRP